MSFLSCAMFRVSILHTLLECCLGLQQVYTGWCMYVTKCSTDSLDHQTCVSSHSVLSADKLFATVSPLAPAQVVIWSKFTITMVMKIDQLDSPKPSPKHPHTASVDSKRLISCVVPFNEVSKRRWGQRGWGQKLGKPL